MDTHARRDTHSALLAGATGLVGARVLARLQADPAWDPITVLARRAVPGVTRARAVLLDFASLADFDPFPPADAVFCALGTTIAAAGSQDAFRRVDHDHVLALARRARAAGASRFVLVSALGADPASRVFYSRVKGETERGLVAMGWPRLTILRPSMLAGERAEFRAGERIVLALTRPLAPLVPARWRPVDADAVACAMVAAAHADAPAGVRIVESAELQRAG